VAAPRAHAGQALVPRCKLARIAQPRLHQRHVGLSRIVFVIESRAGVLGYITLTLIMPCLLRLLWWLCSEKLPQHVREDAAVHIVVDSIGRVDAQRDVRWGHAGRHVPSGNESEITVVRILSFGGPKRGEPVTIGARADQRGCWARTVVPADRRLISRVDRKAVEALGKRKMSGVVTWGQCEWVCSMSLRRGHDAIAVGVDDGDGRLVALQKAAGSGVLTGLERGQPLEGV